MKACVRLLFVSFLLIFSHVATADTVDINTADAQTLAAAMVGVGEKRAEAIVIYREEHGPFRSIDDLIQVSGIGTHTLEANREKLRVSEQ
jgi:competence protein ComEA